MTSSPPAPRGANDQLSPIRSSRPDVAPARVRGVNSSDAIMLAQLAGTMLIATGVAYVSTIQAGVELSRLTKFNAYMGPGVLGFTVVLALITAAASEHVSRVQAIALYVAVGAGTLTTVAALWGQLQAIHKQQKTNP